MTQDYILLFKPIRPDDADPGDPAVLMPILVHEDGRQLALDKVVNTVEKALSMEAGFSLAHWIADAGGFDGVTDIIEERVLEGDDDVHPSEE